MMSRLVSLLSLAGLLAVSGLAWHYRGQRTELQAALTAAEKASARPRPRPARLPAAPAPASAGPARSEPAVAPAATRVGEDSARAAARWEMRVRQLEAEVQAKDALIASLRRPGTNQAANAPREPRTQQRRSSDWAQAMRTNDPQRYAAITQRIEQVRAAVSSALAETQAYFLNQDPARLTPEEQAAYIRMGELLKESGRLMNQMQMDMAPSERRQAMRKLMENRRAIEPMLDYARSREWINLGLDLGYSESEAQALGQYIERVIGLTSPDALHRALRGGGRRGGPGPR